MNIKPFKTENTMKADVIKLANYYECTTEYSGKNRIMYLHGNNAKEACVAIKAQLSPGFTVLED